MRKHFLTAAMILAVSLFFVDGGYGIEMLPDSYQPVAIGTDSAGNIIVTSVGKSYKLSPEGEYVIDSLGQEIIMEHHYDAAETFPVEARAAIVDHNGNLYVAGIVKIDYSARKEDFAVVKYNSNGQRQWSTTYNGPSNESDILDAITFDVAGNIYVSGMSYDNQTHQDMVTIKYSPTGNQEWIARYDFNNVTDIPINLVVDEAGDVYVLGFSNTGTFVVDTTTYSRAVTYVKEYVIVKYNYDETENEVTKEWETYFPGNKAIDLALDSQGSLYVTGEITGTIALVKYGTDGNMIWAREYGDPTMNHLPRDIVVTGNNDIVVLAIRHSPLTNYDYLQIKYDLNGGLDEAGTIYYDGGFGKYDSPRALALTGEGQVYMTGSSYGNLTYDIATVKNQNTSHRYDIRTALPQTPPVSLDETVLNDLAKAITVDGNGNVIVYGITVRADLYPDDQSPEKYQYSFSEIIIKYNSSLEKQWVWPNELEQD